MKQMVGQAFLILAVSAVLAWGSHVWRPDVLPWDVVEIELELAEASSLEGAIWLDARMEEEFAVAHLPGALLLNEEDWESGFVGLLEVWTPDRAIVVYCSTLSCLRSYHVAKRLRDELGTDEVYSLKGGWQALQVEGLVEGDGR